LDSIIIFEGLSVAAEESKIPKEEKQRLDKVIPIIKISGLFRPAVRKGILKSERTKVTPKPKRKPANISPKRINSKETGQLISLSKVRCLVSQGVIIGPTEEEAKNTAMAITAGNKAAKGALFPRKKARKRKQGKIRP